MHKYYLKYGIKILFIAIIFNILETIYFGFNDSPMSRAEEICDVISQLLFNTGVILLLVAFVSKSIKGKLN